MKTKKYRYQNQPHYIIFTDNEQYYCCPITNQDQDEKIVHDIYNSLTKPQKVELIICTRLEKGMFKYTKIASKTNKNFNTLTA